MSKSKYLLEDKHSIVIEYLEGVKFLTMYDYLSSKYSCREVVRKYEFSNHSLLFGWIKKYNSTKYIENSAKGKSAIMNKGRNTT
ncbi:hypothetical protein [Abyssisolibacter fermentans]|uniref:hypothetical protein n=1 Tax=Abyssisolibacter fermentans TaxID=1766203 RepID=UPI00082D68AC|nr:hypothetical protein [Abyssisolibacter fermentans]